MNKLRQTPFKMLTLFLCFIAMEGYGQNQTKTFKEKFNVAEDALLAINTSHADIEFETWGKNEVEIEAIIEIDGATKEEAKKYLENSGFEILGNSKKVSISTGSENRSLWSNEISGIQNFHIETPEFPEVHGYTFDFDFEELSDMPPLPISPMTEFDHKAFAKDGEKYLKKWQKEFVESYDEEHSKKLEEWTKRMEEKQGKMEKRRAKLMEERAELREKRAEKLIKRREKMTEARAKRMEAYKERRSRLVERRRLKISNDPTNIFFIDKTSGGRPSIFYSSDGLHKNYKVKKTIKVKIPKGMKIKMNVRHGEVKLAENTKNLNAVLSHSSLWAVTIDGDKTTISASYSPVNVQNWNYGTLQANYSEQVDLKKVINLRLNANSSDVTIDKLMVSAFIKNDFGPLQINSVDNDFKEIDISLQNAELNCKTPAIPFTIYVNGTSSKLTAPARITLNRTKNGNTIIHKGYLKNRNAAKSIRINSKYSEVILE